MFEIARARIKISQVLRLFGLLTLVFLFACSKKFSSNGAPVDNGNGFFPTIPFSFPVNLTGETKSVLQALQSRGSDPLASMYVLSEWGFRTNRSVSFINTYLETLNKAYLPSDFTEGTKELSNGNKIAIKVADLTDDGDFTRHALLCYEGNRFLYMKWSADQSKFKVVRNYNYNPHLSETSFNRGLVLELDYARDPATNDAQLTVNSNGQVWNKPDDITQESFLIERIDITKKPDNSMMISGVNAWKSVGSIDNSYSGQGEGDVWLVSAVNPDGSSNYLAHRKFNLQNACKNPFNDDSLELSNWCYGGFVGSTGGGNLYLESTEFASLWPSLQSVPIAKDETTKFVAMPTVLECPVIEESPET